jgi:hypothetical protein
MGERPAGRTLDRLNVNGHYEPGNCVWSTPKEQRRNQRKRGRIEEYTTEELRAELTRRGEPS